MACSADKSLRTHLHANVPLGIISVGLYAVFISQV